jgi:type IV fimbrial biogenesis protein FimT
VESALLYHRACARALTLGARSGKSVASILAAGLDRQPITATPLADNRPTPACQRAGSASDHELCATNLVPRHDLDQTETQDNHSGIINMPTRSAVPNSAGSARTAGKCATRHYSNIGVPMKPKLLRAARTNVGSGSREGQLRHAYFRARPLPIYGFTLIELMIGLVMAAFLISLGLPSFAEFLRNSEIRSTTESIVNGLRLARSEAANRNQPITFALAGGGSAGWTVTQVSDNSLIQHYSKQEGATNTAVAIQPARAIAVTFNGLGRIIPAATPANPNLQQLDISSVLASGSRALRILVDDTRGIRTCDPSPLLAALVPRDPRTC